MNGEAAAEAAGGSRFPILWGSCPEGTEGVLTKSAKRMRFKANLHASFA
jgi:hypothetical protein